MIVVADIGGTHFRIACAEDDGTIGNLVVESSPQKYEDGLALFEKYKNSLGDKKIDAISIGLAGHMTTMNEDTFKSSSNLPDWGNKPLKTDLRAMFGVPVYLANDTAMGALGEAIEGAGKGIKAVAYVAIGTGIGGRIVTDGSIDPNSDLSIGHKKYLIGGAMKELEGFVSGNAIIKERGIKASELHDPMVWDTYARYFAYGMHYVLMKWKPDIAILGGFLVHPDRLSTKNIEKYLHKLFPQSTLPPLAYATLPYSGLTGAYLYAKHKLQSA